MDYPHQESNLKKIRLFFCCNQTQTDFNTLNLKLREEWLIHGWNKEKSKDVSAVLHDYFSSNSSSRGKPAQAANLPAKEELFDYDDLMPKTENGDGTGRVKDFLSQNITIDSAGRQYKATNFMRIGDFDVSKPNVKVVTSAYDKSSNPRTINMEEKCDNSENSPYRYQFFFQVNKLASPNATHWHTEYFQLTSKMIKTCGVSSEGKPMQGGYYNTLQKGTDSTRAERLELKGGSLFPKSRVINSGGAYGMDVYIIDIKPWYLKGKKNYHLMNRNVYVQSVTNHYDASGWAIIRRNSLMLS